MVPTPSPSASVIYVQQSSDDWAITLAAALSIAAIVVSLVALTWNIVTYVPGGPRVRFELRITYPVDDPAGGIQSIYPEQWPKKMSQLDPPTDPSGAAHLVIRVRSIGRTAVTVEEVAVGGPGNRWIGDSGGLKDQKLPYTIETGGPALVYTHPIFDRDDNEDFFVRGKPRKVRGWAALSDGRIKVGRFYLLPDDDI